MDICSSDFQNSLQPVWHTRTRFQDPALQDQSEVWCTLISASIECNWNRENRVIQASKSIDARYGRANDDRLQYAITILQSLSTTILYAPSSILWISVWFLLIHTLYILWCVFHACASRLLMGCNYYKWNGKKCLIWLYYNNQTKICQSLFWNVIHAYMTSGYQQYLHFCQLEHLLWLNQVLLTLFFRNMNLAGHMGGI